MQLEALLKLSPTSLSKTLSLTQEESLCQLNANNIDPLQLLKPSEHSLLYLYILNARLKQSQQNPFYLLEAAGRFSENAEKGQLEGKISKVNEFAGTVTRFCSESFNHLAVGILRNLILLIAPSFETLTLIHPLFLRTCILSREFNVSESVIECGIEDLNPSKYQFTVKEFLEYTYYAGICYLGLKKYKEALEYFKMCLSSPAQVPSLIQIESYKKFTLTSLILNGKLEKIPKCTSTAVKNAHQYYNQIYTSLSTLFESKKLNNFKATSSKYEQEFKKDDNWGLVKLCYESLIKQSITRLTQTYLTLSLADIATSVGLGSDLDLTEKIITSMVEDGDIFASISEKEGDMVYFSDSPEKFKTITTTQFLHKDLNYIQELNMKMTTMDRKIALSKNYISKISKNEKSGSTNVSASGVGGFLDDDELYSYD